MPLRTILPCLLLLLLASGTLSAREPVTREQLLAALTGNKFLGTSADGYLAWLQESSGTVELEFPHFARHL